MPTAMGRLHINCAKKCMAVVLCCGAINVNCDTNINYVDGTSRPTRASCNEEILTYEDSVR